MAKVKLPDPLERRHLVERELDAAKALRLAEAYLEAGRRIEAIDFLRKAEDSEQLESLRECALEEGDVFLLRAVAAATGVAPRRPEWQRIAETAEAAGKERFAAEARRQAEVGED